MAASPALRLAALETRIDAHETHCEEFRADQKQLNRQILAELKELRRLASLLLGALAMLEICVQFVF